LLRRRKNKHVSISEDTLRCFGRASKDERSAVDAFHFRGSIDEVTLIVSGSEFDSSVSGPAR